MESRSHASTFHRESQTSSLLIRTKLARIRAKRARNLANLVMVWPHQTRTGTTMRWNCAQQHAYVGSLERPEQKASE